MNLDFSSEQQKVVTAALTLVALVAIVLSLVWFLKWVALFLETFSSVFVPLTTGAILALIIKPYHEWLTRKTGNRPVVAVALVFASVLVPTGAFLWFFGAILLAQLGDILTAMPEFVADTGAWLETRWPIIQPALSEQRDVILQVFKRAGESALTVGLSLADTVGGLLSWFVLPIYLAFFLLIPSAKGSSAEKLMPFLKEGTRRDVVFLLEQFIEIVVSFFRGQLIIAMIQGIMYATGFGLIGLRFGVILGLVLGFLNIIPYLGSIIGFSVCLPLAYFQPDGGWLTVFLVVGVIGLVQFIEGYVLTPRIMGERTGLHPLVIIVAIFFWGTALSGILGMVLAIPLTAFLVVFWRLAREKYIHEWI